MLANVRKTLYHARSGTAVLLLACCMASCGNDIEKVKMFEPHELPDNTIYNAKMQRSEKGKLQLLMTAPLIEQYSKPEAKTEYRKGVYMRFFNGYNKPTGILRACYAIQYDKRDVTMVRDSVVIIDLQHGDTVYLKDLTWNAMEHRIYSNNPVHSKNGLRVTYGDGFESDDSFREPKIIHQRGTIEWTED